MLRWTMVLPGACVVLLLGSASMAWATDVPLGVAPTEETAPTQPPPSYPPPYPTPEAPPPQPMQQPWPPPTLVAPPPPSLPVLPNPPPPSRPTTAGVSAGLGITGSLTYGFGFAYQRSFHRGHWQINGVPMVWDRGDNAVVSAGTAVVWYPWLASNKRPLGSSSSETALRIVGGGSVFYNARKSTTTTLEGTVDPNGVPRPAATTTTFERNLWLSVGVGAGFEFGAIQQPGFSVALDLLWTATWAHTSTDGWSLRQVVPLPAGSLVYHW